MVEGPPCCQLPQNCRTVTATGQDVLGGEGRGDEGREGEGRGGRKGIHTAVTYVQLQNDH